MLIQRLFLIYMVDKKIQVFSRNREMQVNDSSLSQAVFCSFNQVLFYRSPAFNRVLMKLDESLGQLSVI